MMATRQIMKVENRKLILDIGEDYEALLNRNVEVLIFPCPEEPESPTKSEQTSPWGALRGSVVSIADDFDELEEGAVWEACR